MTRIQRNVGMGEFRLVREKEKILLSDDSKKSSRGGVYNNKNEIKSNQI